MCIRDRRDLDEVEVGLLGELERLVGRHDADRLAVRADEAYLGDPDPVVDPKLGADVSSCLSVNASGDQAQVPARESRSP